MSRCTMCQTDWVTCPPKDFWIFYLCGPRVSGVRMTGDPGYGLHSARHKSKFGISPNLSTRLFSRFTSNHQCMGSLHCSGPHCLQYQYPYTSTARRRVERKAPVTRHSSLVTTAHRSQSITRDSQLSTHNSTHTPIHSP